ncbi:hypothetical protein E3N88_34580 [Mikania micrantha]|uniref:Uncharacterized protein n=1 Tax=Mikania micrantha TaxID=192012 RepID=A0A5N6LYJ2_9ASTR|nr:hypothetical protein E3N88_34580 [Mikania micrantha]
MDGGDDGGCPVLATVTIESAIVAILILETDFDVRYDENKGWQFRKIRIGIRKKRTAANKKKKRGEEEFSSLAEPASFSVSFPEFQSSDRLHFWTASSSHPGELIQR